MTTAKQNRLNVRLRAADDDLIRRAAQTVGQTVTEFLTTSAVERAHHVLADQRSFVLADDAWAMFIAALDHPVRPDPRLVELFARPQRITREQ
jgi:uncharacterized protein (DUF1778 family)